MKRSIETRMSLPSYTLCSSPRVVLDCAVPLLAHNKQGGRVTLSRCNTAKCHSHVFTLIPSTTPFYQVILSCPIRADRYQAIIDIIVHTPLSVHTTTYTMSVLRSIPRSINIARRAASTSAPLTVASSRSNASAPILANIEASWKSLPAEEQYEVYQQLEEIQKRDWKELTIDEKKAGE